MEQNAYQSKRWVSWGGFTKLSLRYFCWTKDLQANKSQGVLEGRSSGLCSGAWIVGFVPTWLPWVGRSCESWYGWAFSHYHPCLYGWWGWGGTRFLVLPWPSLLLILLNVWLIAPRRSGVLGYLWCLGMGLRRSVFGVFSQVYRLCPQALLAIAEECVPVAHLFAQLDASHLSSPDPQHLYSF